MKLELAAAYWVIEKLPGEKIPGIAADAVAAGIESPSLLALSTESPAPRRELADLFMNALRECDVEIPDRQAAVMVVARHFATQMLAGEIAIREGLSGLVRDACHVLDHPPRELAVFIGLESEYDDFSDDTRNDYYGEDHCRQVLLDIEEKARLAAKQLLNS